MNLYLIPGIFPQDYSKADSFLFVNQWKIIASLYKESNFIATYTGDPSHHCVSLRTPLQTLRELYKNFRIGQRYSQKEGNWRLNLTPLVKFYKFGEEEYFKRAVRYHLKMIRKAERQVGKIDLIHVRFGLQSARFAQALSEVLKIPYVITESFSGFLPSAMSYEASKPLIKENLQAYQKAGGIIVVSQVLKEALSHLDISNIEVIPSPVSPDFLKPNFLKLSSTPFAFFTLGRLVSDKGVDILLESINLLKEQSFFEKSPCHFYIGGDGSERFSYEAFIHQFDLTPYVTFLGHLNREQVREWYDRTHAYILPSRVDTYPNVLIEALARGRPVVATRSGGAQEVVCDLNGLLVEPASAKDLALGIQTLCERYNRYNFHAIQDHIQGIVDPCIIFQKIQQVYQRALGKK